MDGASATSRIVRLDRTAGPPAFRIAAWREHMSVSGKIEVADEAADSFVAELEGRIIGDLFAVRVATSAFRFFRDRAWLAGKRPDLVFINLVEEGEITGLCGPRNIRAVPGSLLIGRLAIPMDVMTAPVWLGLVVPKDLLDTRMVWQPRFDGRVYAPGSMPAVILGGHIRALLDLGPLSRQEQKNCIEASLALIAASLDATPPPSAPVANARQVRSERAVKSFIVANLGDAGLAMSMICRTLGLGPSQVQAALGPGVSLSRRIRQLRLHAAYRDLVSGRADGRTLKELGERHGMPDERTFRRAFAQEFGFPPSRLRRSTGARARLTAGSLRTAQEIESWFLGYDPNRLDPNE